MEKPAHPESLRHKEVGIFFGKVVEGMVFVVISLLLGFNVGGGYAVRKCPGGACMTVSRGRLGGRQLWQQ